MRPLSDLLRKHILTVKPYSSARSEYPTANTASNQASSKTFLDANENAFGSPSEITVNRYPDPLQMALKRRICEIKQIPESRIGTIFLGNGSDEPIDLIIRAFCEPSVHAASGEITEGDAMIITPPTYGMYEVSAAIHHVAVKRVPLVRTFEGKTGTFRLDEDGIKQAITPRTKLIFLCSPNNPTANVFDRSALERIITGFDGIVILDEAYIDFAEAHSFLPHLAEFPNLVILQTFSKAWGMAALRLGMAFADSNIIEVLNKIKPPYNINILTQETALKALQHTDWKERVVRDILEERETLMHELSALHDVQHVFPSDANFILAHFTNARAVYERLVEKGIVVRDRSGVTLCEDCLRITVGTPFENERLLAALTSA